MALSSTNIIKVIVVTEDLEKTAEAYEKLLGTGVPKKEDDAEHNNKHTPYMTYKGAAITDTPMKVKSVYSDNFWFEIIQPLGTNDPWSTWLKEHGTSICAICLNADGALEQMKKQ
ncbi:MAG: hypothetical protein ACK5MN_04160 [Lachnospiraceae bacterium]